VERGDKPEPVRQSPIAVDNLQLDLDVDLFFDDTVAPVIAGGLSFTSPAMQFQASGRPTDGCTDGGLRVDRDTADRAVGTGDRFGRQVVVAESDLIRHVHGTFLIPSASRPGSRCLS
jgi:hypothetical protein